MVAGHSGIRDETSLSGREIPGEEGDDGGGGEAQRKAGSEGGECVIKRERAAADTAEKSRKMSTEEELELC